MTTTELLALPGAALLAACLVGRYIAPWLRRHVRPYVLRKVHEQIPGVAQLQQRLRSTVLDVAVKLSALTVTVEFYLLSLPPSSWVGGHHGPVITMALTECMAVATYVTCVLKDILSCPRPVQARGGYGHALGVLTGAITDASASLRAKEKAAAGKAEDPPPPASRAATQLSANGCAGASPAAAAPVPTGGRKDAAAAPGDGAAATAAAVITDAAVGADVEVEVLEEAYRGEVEFGAPSMHTLCAFLMPAYGAILVAQLGVISWHTAGILVAAAGCWSCWVALSRLYLGVHTPIDLITGFLTGAVFLGVWARVGVHLATLLADPHIATAALAAVLAVHLVALCTYPMPMSHSTSYEYPVIFLGAAFGGFVGLSGRFSVARHVLPALQAFAAEPHPLLRHPAVVAVAGYVAMAVAKLLSKEVLSLLLPPLLGCVPLRVRRLWQPPVHPTGCVGSRGAPVLMKSQKLAYDVDFVRKFLNYAITVYVVLDFQYVARYMLPQRATS